MQNHTQFVQYFAIYSYESVGVLMSINIDDNRELAENKILLLYIIDKLNLPVTNTFITKVVLENSYMNYFFLQQFLSEMLIDEYLESKTEDSRSMYIITTKGKEVLNMFTDLLPIGLKKRIASTVREIRKNYRNETMIISDYTCENENEYVVKCKIKEDDFSLIDIKVTVGSKEEAINISNNWRAYADILYTEVLDSLIKNRKQQGS